MGSVKDGWEVKKLGEVCELIKRGVAPKYTEDTLKGLCVINQKCIRDHKVNYSLSRLHDVSLKKINPERLVLLGDVLVNSTGTGTLGRVAQIRETPADSCTVDTHVTIVRPIPNLFYNDFFGYALIKIEEEIINSGEGASGQTELARTKLQNNFYISYPESLVEQKQIVALLDQAFAAIDQAKANLEKNIQNAQELFQSKLNAIFSQSGEGWEEKTVDEITKVTNGYSFKSGDFSDTGKIKSIKITNVGVKEFVEEEGNYLPTSFAEEYSKVKVSKGNIVLALTRTIISNGLKIAVIPDSYDGALLNQRVAAIIPNEKIIGSEYLYFYFSSKVVYNYVLANVNTLMQPNLSIKDLKTMLVPVCSLEQQEIIKSTISSLSKHTNGLCDNYQTKLNNLAELKKSILQKAFNGELT